ncbi:MAG: hypothetical protein AAGE96_21070 [Cyanobacteria bacterium P01_G01_bin.19]
MKLASKYWNLVRIDSSGKIAITEISQAKQFFQMRFATTNDCEDLADLSIQRELLTEKKRKKETSISAERCLRCFISHQIRQVCIQLDLQFGREHGFSSQDLYIYTLNDTLDNFRDSLTNSQATNSKYKPLSVEILETFDPHKANLTTWTTRYVKQNRELQRFLLEQGVYLISNWAILNDTNEKQVKRILTEFHNLTPSEIEQASLLLLSYHAVYRRDRLKNRQGKGKCQTPTAEQLTRIASLTKKKGLLLSPEQTLSQLEQLASLLREYRIHVRGGRMKQESLDNAERNTEGMQAAVVSETADSDEDQDDFLKSYQQQFQTSLDRAIANVINIRLSKFKGKKAAKAPQFISALELFHCRGESMGAIAPKIGLEAQYQVTRLLKLKELRADIRHDMLQLMRDWTMNQNQLADLAALKQREAAIEAALGEQIDRIIDEAEKEVSIADSTASILARRICDYLDRHHT